MNKRTINAVRNTIVLTALYFCVSYSGFYFFNKAITFDIYILLFEWCLCVITWNCNHIYCKFLRYTIASILISDSLCRLDYYLDFLPTNNILGMLPGLIIFAGILACVISAINHYVRLNAARIKRCKQILKKLYKPK